MLPIAPSTYYEQKAREKDPSRQPARAKRDGCLHCLLLVMCTYPFASKPRSQRRIDFLRSTAVD